MNRAEAMEQFQNTIVSLLCENARSTFYQLFQEKQESFYKKFIQGFEEIVQLVKKDCEEEPEISFVLFSFLRTHVIDGSYLWYVEAQEKEGYLKKEKYAIMLDLSEFFTPFEELERKLKSEIWRYANQITEMDVEKIKVKEFERCIPYFYFSGLRAFLDICKNSWYQDLKKAELFRILVGEYQGVQQIVHIMDVSITKEMLLAELTKEEPEITEDSKAQTALEKEHLSRRHYEKMVIDEQKIVRKNLFYSVMREAKIEKSIFLFCNLIGVDFEEALISESYFQVCTLQQANFRRAKIYMTGFAGSRLEIGGLFDGQIKPGIYPVSFQDAVLEVVDFSYADVSGCDFRKATFREVSFLEAKMDGALFDQEALCDLVLTKEQRASIVVI